MNRMIEKWWNRLISHASDGKQHGPYFGVICVQTCEIQIQYYFFFKLNFCSPSVTEYLPPRLQLYFDYN